MDTSKIRVSRFVKWYCALAGLMDAGTGLLLLVVPAFTLKLMGVESEGEPTPYIRFIGAFVFSVGCLYLAAWYVIDKLLLREWNILWLVTAWIRLCVGLTVSVLLFTQQLDLEWISVPIADLGLAIFQLLYFLKLRKANG